MSGVLFPDWLVSRRVLFDPWTWYSSFLALKACDSVGVAILSQSNVVTLGLQHFHSWICPLLCECDGSRTSASNNKLVKLLLRSRRSIKVGDLAACLQLFPYPTIPLIFWRPLTLGSKALGAFPEGFRPSSSLSLVFSWWLKMSSLAFRKWKGMQ